MKKEAVVTALKSLWVCRLDASKARPAQLSLTEANGALLRGCPRGVFEGKMLFFFLGVS